MTEFVLGSYRLEVDEISVERNTNRNQNFGENYE